MMGGGEKLFNLRQRLMRAPAGLGSGLWTTGPRLRLHPAGVERSPKLHLRGLTVRVLFSPAKSPCLAQAGPRQVATIPTLFP
jgi:hypothetical protein